MPQMLTESKKRDHVKDDTKTIHQNIKNSVRVIF